MSPVARALSLLPALHGHSFEGRRLNEIARAAELIPSTALRHLEALAEAGLVERDTATDRWRLGPALVQIALAHQAEVARMESRLDSFRNRYSRAPSGALGN